jgi:hypothetical protein
VRAPSPDEWHYGVCGYCIQRAAARQPFTPYAIGRPHPPGELLELQFAPNPLAALAQWTKQRREGLTPPKRTAAQGRQPKVEEAVRALKKSGQRATAEAILLQMGEIDIDERTLGRGVKQVTGMDLRTYVATISAR